MKVLGCLLLIFAFPCVVNAASTRQAVQKGNQYFHKQDFVSSLKKYQEALENDWESDIINFNIGTAYYKNGNFFQAIEHLQKSLLAQDEALQQKTHYNLGNALYKLGIAKENVDAAFAVLSLEQSLKQYESALNLDTSDQDTQFNYDFVKKELERLKQKKNQQQQQQQKFDHQKNKGQPDQQNQENQQHDQQQSQNQDSQPNEEQASKSQQDQEGSSEEQQSQSQQDSQPQQEDSGEQGQPSQQTSSGQQPLEEGQLTEREAQMLLDNYQQTEEPQGLLQVFKGKTDTRPVLKDW